MEEVWKKRVIEVLASKKIHKRQNDRKGRYSAYLYIYHILISQHKHISKITRSSRTRFVGGSVCMYVCMYVCIIIYHPAPQPPPLPTITPPLTTTSPQKSAVNRSPLPSSTIDSVCLSEVLSVCLSVHR